MPNANLSKLSGKKNLFLILGGLALLIAIAVYFYSNSGTRSGTIGGNSTVTVSRGDIEEIVTAQGKLEPKEYVVIGAQVSGQLKKFTVDLGSTVKKGDLLAEIDPRLYQTQVEADEAELKAMNAQLVQQKASLALARQKHERNERLIASEAVSREAVETTKAELDVAAAQLNALEAQIERSRSTVNRSRTNLEYARIYAPIDGTIVSFTAREGQTLNANQTAPEVLKLANLDVMTVQAQVAEADIMRLKSGMSVYFTTLGSERRWYGKVRQIQPAPDETEQASSGVVLYIVLIDVDNRDRKLMTGMTAQLFFVIGEAKDSILLPVAGLGRRLPDQDNDKGQAYSVRMDGAGDKERRVIHVGLVTRSMAEVRDGLKEGDKVAVQTAAALLQAGADGVRRSQQRQQGMPPGGGMRGGPQL